MMLTRTEGKQLFFFQRMLKTDLQVRINTSKIGVILPNWLYDQPSILLAVGLYLAKPIPDLEVNEDGIRGTMSFNQQPFKVSIPWTAVWMLIEKSTGVGCLWLEDAPVQPVAEAEPELPATGTDSPRPPHQDAYIEQLKPKRKLPPGWGGIVKNNPEDEPPAAA